VIVDPEAANLPSRRVLENNQFVLLAERQLPTEPTDAPIAIYRLPPDPTPIASRSTASRAGRTPSVPGPNKIRRR
jgi:hypothetical protein